jgi:Flp pilus assembly protein TadB
VAILNIIRKVAITFFGGLLLIIGVVLIVLPGPAILVIPAALAVLSLEYPLARRALKKFQRYSSRMARKLDRKFRA